VTLKLSDLDLNFTATNYSEVKNNPRNPSNAIVRFEFLEIIPRLAFDKYYKTNQAETHYDSVKMMLDACRTHM
jgi:hypothetical protein